jgi:signal transduction histidine kinase
LESGHVEVETADVPVDETLAAAEALVHPQLLAKGLRFEYECDFRAIVMRADRERAQQIVMNLLSNAIKFTEPGGLVRLTARRDGAWIRVRVCDTGRGIPAEAIDRIFRPFVQVERGRNAPDDRGSGLGLAISRDLARLMGGDLAVESTPGVGSTFTLSLPVGKLVLPMTAE